ncbi:hypothetical protein BUY35_07240 [Staphylococcus cohnii]|nr:hypothetical protein BUY35_07240 [Staphylococcus cohnii]
MRKITDEETLKSIRGGVPAKKQSKTNANSMKGVTKGAIRGKTPKNKESRNFESMKGVTKGAIRGFGGFPIKENKQLTIDEWITELSLAIEHYIGNVRKSGVYRLVSKPYTVKELKHYDEANNESKQQFLMIDDVINMYSDNLEEKYHLHAETEIDNVQDFANLHSSKINMSLDAVTLRKEVKQLQSSGYKVALYETQYSNHCLVAIKGKEIKYNLEKDFITLNYEKRESAKDFASKINELENKE